MAAAVVAGSGVCGPRAPAAACDIGQRKLRWRFSLAGTVAQACPGHCGRPGGCSAKMLVQEGWCKMEAPKAASLSARRDRTSVQSDTSACAEKKLANGLPPPGV